MKSAETRPKNIFVLMLFPLNSKNVLYLFLGILFVSVLVFTEWPLVSINDAAHKRLVSMSWLLVPHILFALTALVTGPFQFSTKLREYNKALHRILGKIYIVSVFLGAVFAFFISQKFPFPGSTFQSKAATVTQAAIWFFTTFMAYVFARKRQIGLHKIWMSRSYGITLIFVFARALNPFRAYFNINADGFGVLLFLLMIIALVVPEILLNRNELLAKPMKIGQMLMEEQKAVEDR